MVLERLRLGLGPGPVAHQARRWLAAVLVLAAAGCREAPAGAAPDGPDASAGWAARLAASASPRVGGNAVEVLVDGPAIFRAMLREIRAARRSVVYEQFAYKDGEIGRTLAGALADRCRAGVAVHVLIDGFGLRWMPDGARRTLEDAGCQFAVFRPLCLGGLGGVNHRTHRRILVVDGRVGFAGGSVVALGWSTDDRGQERLRETDARVEGPVVAWLQRAFAAHWREATGRSLDGPAYYPPLAAAGDVEAQIVDSSPRDGAAGVQALYMDAITGARRRVAITNQYLVLDDAATAALRDAAGRGVRVDVIIPGDNTNRLLRAAGLARLDRLLLAGVRVHAYGPRSLHAKTMVVDGALSTVGSANLDPRSFAINEELNLVAHGEDVADRLEAVFEDDLASTRPITYETWARRSVWLKALGLLSLPVRGQL